MKLDERIGARIEDPSDKRAYVRGLFAGISGRYDLTNDVMSLGLHRRWKRRTLEVADLRAGQRVLDLAAGTGDLARGAISAVGDSRGVGDGLDAVAVDLTPEMLRVGMDRPGPDLTGWVAGDALELPFADRTFDRVLIGYGLRNFADLDGSLAEILRCLRPGGRMAALDFGHPRSRTFAKAYMGYLDVSTRVVGWALHRDAESYVYIPESLRRFPGQRGVLAAMERAGYESCGIVDFLWGAMAINYGDRPAA